MPPETTCCECDCLITEDETICEDCKQYLRDLLDDEPNDDILAQQELEDFEGLEPECVSADFYDEPW